MRAKNAQGTPTQSHKPPSILVYEDEWQAQPQELVSRSSLGSYLTESVYLVVLQKSIPAQIPQLVLHVSDNKGYVDGFVRESTFAKRPYNHFL